MLAVGEVLDKARTYLGEVVPEFARLEPKVEEMVRYPETSEWKITFFAQTLGNPKAETVADLLSQKKVIKVVDIDGNDGSLIAVRNPVPF